MASNYSTELAALTERRFVDKKVSNTVMESTAVGTKLMEKKSTGTGKYVEKSIRKDQVYTAAEFAVGGTYTATGIDNVDNLQANYRHIGDAIEFNELEMDMNEGEQKVISKVDDNIDTLVESLEQRWNDNIHFGTNSSNMWSGFDNQFSLTGDYLGVTRSGAKALVPYIINATTSVGSATGGTVACTNGSATLTGTSTTFLDSGIVAGDIIEITDDSGFVRPYIIATVTSNTSLTLATTWAQATMSGNAYTCKGHFNDTAHYGDAGKFSLNKVDHGFTLASNNGTDSPDLIWCQAQMFERFRSELRTKNLYTGESRDPGIKRFRNFLFNNADVVIDPRCPNGRIRMVNTKYIKFEFLAGWDKFALKPGPDGKTLARVTASSGAKFVTLVGQTVVSGNMLNWGLNRACEIQGLNQ